MASPSQQGLYMPTSTVQRILCCECGTSIEPNPANMCLCCIRSRVDITEGIPKQIVVNFCRGCDRYLQPPMQWLACALESKELLALLLKRIKGLAKVRLIDAGFIWTEPHSKRIKVKLTIQKEAFAATILQQTFVVEAVVANQQCIDCARREAKNTWVAVVQVRQKVEHKRTFLFLEQLILKHQAHRETVNIRTVREGIDFFFASRSQAIKFVDFLAAVVPVRSKSSEQIITQDTHSGDSTYKFTFSVEIVPICKDDLVLLPPKVARSLGGISPLLLCTRIGTTLHFMDANTLQTTDIATNVYWRDPFVSLASSKGLAEFYVLDVEMDGRHVGKQALANVIVARASDFGRNSVTFNVRSHLGNILKSGDVVLGYDLSTANYNNDDFEAFSQRTDVPDIVLVRKSYAHLRKNGRRNWALKEMIIDADDNEKPSSAKSAAPDADYQRFMEELEEDPEMRAQVNLYRNPAARAMGNEASSSAMEVIESGAEDADVPRIAIEDLLEDLSINDGGAQE